ncbi:hypothetical protein AX15_003885 [Amanita polypyramis BW_CC]|nr:hypothetical protein AX15_003885 [Amanita polypyramis BW_CC]
MVRVATLVSTVAFFSGLVSATPSNAVANTWVPPTESSQPSRGFNGHGSSSDSGPGGYRSASQGNGYATPMYGSGSAPWAGSDYNDCVNQCVAQYGSRPSPYVPSPTMNLPSGTGSSGTGTTHTVIVAPSQGVLRYVPFALNASVGDTIKFMWGANTHTVTKSSSLSPCNATQDSPFTSGVQNKGFVYTQVVSDTNPTFFHCAVPTHCSKGMFGIINPPNAFGTNTSVSGMMNSMMANVRCQIIPPCGNLHSIQNPHISAYAYMVNNATNSKDNRTAVAAKWGGSMDMGSLPSWAHTSVAENVLYTRNFLAVNLDLMKPDGTVDLGASGKNPMMIPMDVTSALVQADAAANSTSSVPAATASFAASSTAAVPSAPKTSNMAGAYNGAIAASSPQVMVALLTVLATFLLVL